MRSRMVEEWLRKKKNPIVQNVNLTDVCEMLLQSSCGSGLAGDGRADLNLWFFRISGVCLESLFFRETRVCSGFIEKFPRCSKHWKKMSGSWGLNDEIESWKKLEWFHTGGRWCRFTAVYSRYFLSCDTVVIDVSILPNKYFGFVSKQLVTWNRTCWALQFLVLQLIY